MINLFYQCVVLFQCGTVSVVRKPIRVRRCPPLKIAPVGRAKDFGKWTTCDDRDSSFPSFLLSFYFISSTSLRLILPSSSSTPELIDSILPSFISFCLLFRSSFSSTTSRSVCLVAILFWPPLLFRSFQKWLDDVTTTTFTLPPSNSGSSSTYHSNGFCVRYIQLILNSTFHLELKPYDQSKGRS